MINKNNSHSNIVISINHILHDQLLKKSEKLLPVLKRYFCSNSQFNLLTCICMVWQTCLCTKSEECIIISWQPKSTIYHINIIIHTYMWEWLSEIIEGCPFIFINRLPLLNSWTHNINIDCPIRVHFTCTSTSSQFCQHCRVLPQYSLVKYIHRPRKNLSK